MEMINAYIIPEITLLCLLLGYVLKMWVKDVDNKWIPTIVTVVGIAAAIAMNLETVTISVIVGGAASGLLSTGLHQLFHQWLSNGGK